MKIALTHAYFIADDPSEQKIMKPYPPLGLLYISSWLKKENHDVSIIDSTFIDTEKWLQQLTILKPEILCFYTNLITKPKLLELLKEAKKRIPDLITIGGGPDLRYNAENYLKNGFDFLIIGEGEESVTELIQAIEKDTDKSVIKGIQFLENGMVSELKERSHFKELKELPLPDRSSIDFEKYLKTWEHHHGIRMANVSTQRGCPYTCKWCSTAVYGQSYRRRPVGQVADEIEQLQKEFRVNGIWFVDDVFTVSHKWIEGLHAEFLRRNIFIKFEIITRAERLNTNVLKQLKEMGCFRIWIGAESGSQKIINAMDRRVDITTVQKMINETKNLGMEAGTFIMVGYPGEGLKEIEETVDHLRKATPNELTATIAYPIKGTSLYDEIKNEIVNKGDWTQQTDRQLIFTRKHSRKFYNMALRYIWNSYAFFKNPGLSSYSYWLKSKILKLALLIYK